MSNHTEQQGGYTRRRFFVEGTIGLAAAYGGGAGLKFALFSAASPTGSEKLDDKENAKYVVLDPITVGQTKVTIVGVRHTPQTLYLNQADIHSKILSGPPFVFLEYFDKEIRKIALPEFKIENEYKQIKDYNSYAGLFFAGVAARCAEANVDVIVVNPETMMSQDVQFSLIGGYSGMLLAYEAISAHQVSRRTFLRGAGVISSVSAVSFFSQMFTPVNRSGDVNLLKYDLLDWRDLSSASGIRESISRYGNEAAEKLSFTFHGHRHNSMRGYLANPKLIDVFRLKYPHLDLVGDFTGKRYSFKNGAWEKVDQFPYSN